MGGWRSRRAASWSPARLAWRSAVGHRRGQALALVAVSALITACTAFAPVYDRAMQQALVYTLLARASPAEKAVTVVSQATIDAGGETDARDPRDLRALVPADVAAHLEPPVLGRTAIVTPVAGDVPPTGQLVWRDGFCEQVELVSGVCPAAAGEVLVSDADVDNFGLSIGSTRTVGSASDSPDEVRLEVVGTYAASDGAWWQGLRLGGSSSVFGGTDPSATHDVWLTTEDTFVEAPILTGESSQAGALVRTESADVDEVLALGDRLRELARTVRAEGENLTVDSDLGALTDDVRAQTAQAHRTVPLLMAPMAVLTVFVLWLVLAAATEQRRREVAVARLRGRGPAGAVGLLLVELLPLLLLGVVPGAAAALAGGAVARSVLPGEAPFEVGAGFVASVLLAAAVVVLTTVAAAVRVAREPLDALVRRGRPPSRRWALGALDAFLLAAVGTGVLAFVTGSLDGPLALAGPALLALFAGLLLAHLVAPAATAGGRRLLRRGRLVSGVTLLETGRRRETRAVIAVITVASALAVFAVDAVAIGERNRTHASEHDAGAPVVLRLAGRDLVGVRAAVSEADPTGRRATPVLVSGETLAVEPDGFREIAYFPRGAPTDAQWEAIAPPAQAPVDLTGSRFSLDVRTGDELTKVDALGSDSEVALGFVVVTDTGTRRRIRLGTVPQPGGTATLTGTDEACVSGCTLAAVELIAAQAVDVSGDLELGDLRVDGRPADWPTAADDWNATDAQSTVIRPTSEASDDALGLLVSTNGLYPAQLTPAWVPDTVAAILPAARRDPLGLVVAGVDGSDRPAESVGRVTLVPAMPRSSALVDLDALSRGAEVSYDAHPEVWLVDDPDLLAEVGTALRERGIAVADLRRASTIRQAYRDTVATWSLGLGAVIGPAVVLNALLVLLVLAVTGWRDRARDLAILRLNGAGRRTTRRLAAWAQVPAILLAVVTGVAAGTVGAFLAMPDVALFPTVPEVPVIDTATAWPAVLYVAVACLVVLPAVAATAGLAVARRARPERVTETV
ncbi:FtsX-like permease family protein [Nocardioides alpinus]|uniref:ABC transporter permease n=1 Tax=Nocardioides alpinus TaxID=748909 RepID=A0A1I0XEY1_9ACTN|nr:FtsX-like permease family protein [Nocardioides alpinus]PKH44286.1 ABC transporter permease [Nocardioides alpinus]SFA98996.1 FtsX-like permease family protein [Nocardioides alpinus]